MADRPDLQHPEREEAAFPRQVQRRAERRRLAREQGRRPVWFGLGLFGLIGWAVAVPTVVGIAIGVWLDRRTSGTVSWTLTFLFIGVVVGCLHAWFWVRQESRRE